MAFSVVPTVVDGDDLTEDFTLAVKAGIDELQDEFEAFRLVPGGTFDGAGATYATWITIGNITVPTWCTSAVVHVDLLGFIASTTGVPTYLCRITIGASGIGNVSGRLDLAASTTQRHNTSWTEIVAAPPTGSQSLIIQVNRTSGTGVCRADTGTIVSGFVRYLG